MEIIEDRSDPYGLSNGIQSPSAATCKLTLLRDDKILSVASGFMIEEEDCWYMVTALHNVTGRDFFSRRCLSPTLAIPNKVELRFYVNQDENRRLRSIVISAELFSNGTPIFLYDWSERGGDIAVFCFPKKSQLPVPATMNDISSKNWTVFAGLDVFALGYPSGLDVNRTPIWKRVSIASEPSQTVDGHNATLIDGLTFSGMSGGPVIIQQSQGFADDLSYHLDKTMSVRMLGVYGGRMRTDVDKSGTLGFYWPMETVEAIIREERMAGDIDVP